MLDPCPIDVRTHIQSLTKASGSLSRSEVRAVSRCSEVGKEVLSHGLKTLVRDADRLPVLRCSSCDGTPIQVSRSMKIDQPDGSVSSTSGKETIEFLVANTWVRYHDAASDTMHTRVAFSDPQPLVHGKAAPAIVGAVLGHWKTLRELGHMGIALESYCIDRCGFEAIQRLLAAHHEQLHDRFGDPTTLQNPDLLWLMEWLFPVGCALHDSQKSLEWCMYSEFHDRDMIRNTFIGIQSLRNSKDLVLKHMNLWIAKHLSFAKPMSSHEMDDMHDLCVALSIAPNLCDFLAYSLNLRWEGGRLWVHEGLANGDAVGLVSSALLTIWRFKQFCDSRWLTSGTSGRDMITGFLFGLDSLIEHILDVEPSKYHISGFGRLQMAERRFLVTVAIVSRVPDAALAELMEDARIARRLDEIVAAIDEEMQWIVNLKPFVWDKLGKLVNQLGPELRHHCISKAHIAIGFWRWRVADTALSRPWSLARGNIAQNLDDLGQEELSPSDHPVVAKLKHLLDIGYPTDELIAGLKLVQEISWSGMISEQQHASLAVLARFHPEYEKATLVARSTVLQLNRLMPKPTADEKALAKLENKLQQLLQQQPNRVGGRHMYMRSLFEAAEAKVWPLGRPRDLYKRIFKGHASLFARKSLTERSSWASSADRFVSEREDAILDDVGALRSQIALAKSRIQKSANAFEPMSMGGAALSPSQLELFSVLLKSPDFKDAAVDAMRKRILDTPPPVQPRPPATPSEAATVAHEPPWLRDVCARRSSFKDTAFLWHDGEHEIVAKFLYARMSQPRYVAVSRLTDITDEQCFPDEVDATNMGNVAVTTWRRQFTADFQSQLSLASLCDKAEADVFVLPNLWHDGGLVVCTDASPILLRSWLARFPLETSGSATGSGHSTNRNSSVDALVLEFPWLKDHLGILERKHSTSSSSTASKAKPILPIHEHDVDTDTEDEEAIGSILDALAVRRDDLAEHQPECNEFQVKLLIARKKRRDAGDISEAHQGMAIGTLAEDFCRTHGLAKSAQYSNSLYGDATSALLARSWCHRMTHFFELAVGSGLPTFTDAEKASYAEPSELTDLAARSTLATDKDIRRRITQMRSLCR